MLKKRTTVTLWGNLKSMEKDNKKTYSELDVKELLVQLSSNFKQDSHNTPSPETIKNLDIINNKMISMEDKIDGVKESMDLFHTENKEEHNKIFDLIEKINDKKADKEVVNEIKNDIKKVVWIILGAVIVAVLALVIKK